MSGGPGSAQTEGQLRQPLLDSNNPSPAQASYQQELEEIAEETQHELPTRAAGPLSKLIFLTVAALLVIGLGTFLTTYVVLSHRPAPPTPPPECRKSAVLVVTQSSSLGHVHEDGTPEQNQRQAIVWSGKGHKATLLFNDLHAMDLDSQEWHPVYDWTHEAKHTEAPIGRWKSVAAYDASLPGIVMMGGDSVLHPKRTPRYLNDLWYLSTNVSFPSWHLSAGNDSADGAGADQGWAEEVFDEELEDGDEVAKHHKLTAGVPTPRRAHAGAVVTQHGVSKLVIFGGKVHGGAVLGDVWSIAVQPRDSAASPLWEKLWDSGVNEGPAPAPRKGHVAVAVPGPEPSLFIWGGRNDTTYFEDGWAFSLSNHSWTELRADPAVHQPRARDHLGAFYHEGSVWIYGGRGGPNYAASEALADLWAFDLQTHKWSKQHIAGAAPPARFLYSMAFYTATVNASSGPDQPATEQQDGRMLIFGGEGQDGCYYSDMWQLSLLERSWLELSKNVPCQRRCGARKSRLR